LLSRGRLKEFEELDTIYKWRANYEYDSLLREAELIDRKNLIKQGDLDDLRFLDAIFQWTEKGEFDGLLDDMEVYQDRQQAIGNLARGEIREFEKLNEEHRWRLYGDYERMVEEAMPEAMKRAIDFYKRRENARENKDDSQYKMYKTLFEKIDSIFNFSSDPEFMWDVNLI
jgi:hypothetical protein